MSVRLAGFCVAVMAAAIAPALPRAEAPAAHGGDFPGWPTHLEGEPLTRLPPGPQDEWFARGFPGRVARFATPDKQVVVRWLDAPTRRLHPASQCFRGAGFSISPRPMRRTSDGGGMSCFAATKDAEALEVCEQIRDHAGGRWPDVSSWYWTAVAAPSGGSWWSYVVVKRER